MYSPFQVYRKELVKSLASIERSGKAKVSG